MPASEPGPVEPPIEPPADPPGGVGLPVRAHARRNREKLIAAARAAFAAADGDVPLEGIAREAGVGIGTLYRHFPSREALVEAVYAAELDDITRSAPTLLEQFPPEDALRAWMGRYAAFVATKRAMVQTLRAGWASGSIAMPTTRERITASVTMILARGAETGSLRADVDPGDVTTLLLGVFLSTAADDDREKVDRLLGLVIDAVRTHAPYAPMETAAQPVDDGRAAG